MEHLVVEHGVTSFKIFMFYGGYGLHGRSSHQNEFLMGSSSMARLAQVSTPRT
jgi:hypothetical protein